MTVKSDIEIAREAKMKPIMQIGKGLGIPEKDLIPYGHTKAKVHLDYIDTLKSKPDGKLILVTAINPTPAGEGKTTTTVGLGDGLNRIGSHVARLTERTPAPGENLLTATIDMVEGLTKAAHFKQAIEEDESKTEIYRRLANTLKNEFRLTEFSIYEVSGNKKQMKPILVDGEVADSCRWCNPQILVRPEACQA